MYQAPVKFHAAVARRSIADIRSHRSYIEILSSSMMQLQEARCSMSQVMSVHAEQEAQGQWRHRHAMCMHELVLN